MCHSLGTILTRNRIENVMVLREAVESALLL